MPHPSTIRALVGFLAIAALVGLGGCGGHHSRDPFTDSRPPPGLADRFYPPEGWAWGLVGVGGGPLQRYGVSAPATVLRGQVLILPDYGETAETWFETARDLNGAGYAVWVLEGVGQGGSQRLADPRDLGHLQSFDGEIAGVRAMIDGVIRPTPGEPLAVIGEGEGALVAARAVETGARPAALALSAPACETRPPVGALWRAVGLGALRAPGERSWWRDGPDDRGAGRPADSWRGAVTWAWQRSNPDLRLGGPSLARLAAFASLQRDAADALQHLNAPTLILVGDRPEPCLDTPGAEIVRVAGAKGALELQPDPSRRVWRMALVRFIERQFHPPAAGAPAPPHGL